MYMSSELLGVTCQTMKVSTNAKEKNMDGSKVLNYNS